MESVALGMRKTQLGWQMVKYFLKDGKVVREEKSEPDLRALALEKLKIEMLMFWGDL